MRGDTTLNFKIKDGVDPAGGGGGAGIGTAHYILF
jgi:hypothetical protein